MQLPTSPKRAAGATAQRGRCDAKPEALRIRPNTTSSFRLWRTKRAKTVPTNCANAWKAKGCALDMTIEKDNKGRPKWFRVQVVRGTDAGLPRPPSRSSSKMGLKKDATQVSKNACSGAVSEWISCLVFAVRVLFLRWIGALGDAFLFPAGGITADIHKPKLFIRSFSSCM